MITPEFVANSIATLVLAAMMFIPLVNVLVGAIVGGNFAGLAGLVAGCLTAAAITFANDETGIAIARDGTISSDQGQRGKLAIVTFDNPQAMQTVGNSLLDTEQPELPAENTRLVQGVLEGSNVQPIVEMTNMIDVMRSYASAQKLIDQADQMRRQAIQELGTPA